VPLNAASGARCQCMVQGASLGRLRPSWAGAGVLGKDLERSLVALERTRCSGIGLQVDEQLDDLVLRDSAMKGDPQLAAQGFAGAEGGRDGD
jgi:hypothetical protein